MITGETTHQLSRLYERRFGAVPSQITPVMGDGSDRHIYRLYSDTGSSVIGVFGPRREENEAFVSFTRSFRTLGLPVPDIFAYDAEKGIYLESDLGDTTMYRWICQNDADSEKCQTMYREIIEWLIKFQVTARDHVDYSKCYQFPAFLEDAIQYDLNYFQTSFLSRFARVSYDRYQVQKDFITFITRLVHAESGYFLYRDFQSKNILLVHDHPFFIDYQSGRRGALQYDVASLLFDANVNLSEAFREQMLYFYIENVAKYLRIDDKIFVSFYYDFATVRMLQALAAFSFLSFDKGKKYFLKSIPNALQNIQSLLAKGSILKDLPELRRILENDLFINPLFDSYRAHICEQ
ncbi:hypothetical protein EH223_01230 [candidate division KSB1 bacterium]|nr:phosphotransferase [candidate division KSB1 bacterium]RQW07013.1 MAG: hypothetical protein EH223_01230 [candidate division KSB1 bacterium]